MAEDELRDRDERARDRDDLARDRDTLSRDEEQFSRERNFAARRVQTWATIILIFMVAGLFYTQSSRQDAIGIIQESALRNEEASLHIEEILVEIQAEQFSPEAQAFNTAIRQAIRDIQVVLEILCDVEEPPSACEELIDSDGPSRRMIPAMLP